MTHSWSANQIFEVRHKSFTREKFVVNIDSKHYTCRKWSLTGIHCCHAVAAIKFLNLSEEDFVPHWFRISTYEETYNSIIYPCNGKQMWSEFQMYCPLLNEFYLEDPKRKEDLKLGR